MTTEVSRRSFLGLAAAIAAGLMLPWKKTPAEPIAPAHPWITPFTPELAKAIKIAMIRSMYKIEAVVFTPDLGRGYVEAVMGGPDPLRTDAPTPEQCTFRGVAIEIEEMPETSGWFLRYRQPLRSAFAPVNDRIYQ